MLRGKVRQPLFVGWKTLKSLLLCRCYVEMFQEQILNLGKVLVNILLNTHSKIVVINFQNL